jgi:hypothetical protein
MVITLTNEERIRYERDILLTLRDQESLLPMLLLTT